MALPPQGDASWHYLSSVSHYREVIVFLLSESMGARYTPVVQIQCHWFFTPGRKTCLSLTAQSWSRRGREECQRHFCDQRNPFPLFLCRGPNNRWVDGRPSVSHPNPFAKPLKTFDTQLGSSESLLPWLRSGLVTHDGNQSSILWKPCRKGRVRPTASVG